MQDDPASDDRAARLRTAQVILRTGAAVLLLVCIGSLVARPLPLAAHVPYVVMLGLHLVTLAGLRRGLGRIATAGFAAVYLAIVLGEMWLGGGADAPALIVLPPVVLFVGLVAGGWPAVVTAAIASLGTLAMVGLQRAELLPPPAPPGPPLANWMTSTGVLVMTAYMLFVALRVIQESRVAAAASGQARRELEEKLMQARRLESVGRLAAGVAHDFNNVLTVVFAEATMLARRGDERARASAAHIHEAAERAAALTRQLLTFGRRQTSDPEIVDVSVIVRQLERLLARFVGGEIRLEVACVDDAPPVRADRIELEQILLNLVTNARDAMPRGGTVTIETAIATPELLARCPVPLASHPAVVLRVRDTGTGIDAATRARLFEPFFTTKEIGKGTGLGLATVYGIVTALGGAVLVDSEPGAGATFSVVLPASDQAVAAAEPRAAPAAAASRAEVLIVDADALVLASLEGLLRDSGYLVRTARSAADVLRDADAWHHPPDLLLADVVMPETSRAEMVQRLHQRHPSLRFLFMSGQSADRTARAGAAGAIGPFVAKPFEQSVLLEKVASVLAQEPVA